MSTQPPFRMPCEAVTGKPLYFLGNPFQHGTVSVVVDKYVNVTTVPNPAGGADIPPYERYTADPSGPGSCETHLCDPMTAPCSPWVRPFIDNIFSKIGTIDLAVAKKRGFKNVFAKRFFNGVTGWTNKGLYGAPDTLQACPSDCSLKKWLSYQAASSQAKYLTISITAKNKILNFAPDGTPSTVWDHEATASTSISSSTGLNTYTVTASPNDYTQLALSQLSDPIGLMTTFINQMTNFNNSVGALFPTVECSATQYVLKDTDGRIVEQLDFGDGTYERHQYNYAGSGFQELVEHDKLILGATSFEVSFFTQAWNDVGAGPYVQATNDIKTTADLTDTITAASIYADIKTLLAVCLLNDDKTYPWRTDSKVGVAPLITRDEVSNNSFSNEWWVKDYGSPVIGGGGETIGDPGWNGHCGIVTNIDPRTGSAIVALDLNVTAGTDLSGMGIGNPFGHCLATAYAITGGSLPGGISFDTTTGLLSGTVAADGHCGITVAVTGEGPAATGEVRGALKPAGYQNFYDFGYLDYVGCCYRPGDGSQTWSWYQFGEGMDVSTFNSAVGCQLPLNATQWTNYWESINKPQGAFLFFADKADYYGEGCISSSQISKAKDADALWAGKYAEILDIWSSQNFARPSGDDKFAYDETQVYCAVNISGSGAGSTWTITDASGSTPADASITSGVWGGKVVNGFYNIASYSSGTLTLGSKVSDLPTNWASRSGDDDVCFGKLRWPTNAALLGRAGVTPDVAGTTFTFDSAKPSFGMDSATHQEQVDFYDAAMTLLAANVTATRTDDSHFTTTAAYPTAKFVTIHGAAWYMNDNAPKGDYALLKWLADFRSIGEYTRLTGITDCSGTQVARPATNTGGGDINNPFASFSQTPGCLPFVPCGPKIVCISPNGETFSNGVTYDFPATFDLDEQYGSKWWAWVQTVMTDLLWQAPHRPCGLDAGIDWKMDDGTCAANDISTHYYAHAPQVETRLTIPCNYGLAQNECAPALPASIQIGWLSPVDHNIGDVAYPPAPPGVLSSSIPASASTAWALHAALCASMDTCRFNYQTPGC